MHVLVEINTVLFYFKLTIHSIDDSHSNVRESSDDERQPLGAWDLGLLIIFFFLNSKSLG
jgi:hypothetical protein